MVAGVSNVSKWNMEAENQEFKVILGYTARSKPTWATRDPISKSLSFLSVGVIGAFQSVEAISNKILFISEM